jgi:hypothetical protein
MTTGYAYSWPARLTFFYLQIFVGHAAIVIVYVSHRQRLQPAFLSQHRIGHHVV